MSTVVPRSVTVTPGEAACTSAREPIAVICPVVVSTAMAWALGFASSIVTMVEALMIRSAAMDLRPFRTRG